MSLHVVFGAGQVGTTLAEYLVHAGEPVRLVTRSPRPAVTGVELRQADAMERTAAVEAARGASAIYHCMNPQYSLQTWRTVLPVLQQNLLAASGATGARVVVLENLYALGDLGGRPGNEDTPIRPRSRKGELRAQLFEGWFGAHRRGDAAVVMGRGSDFFGPRGTQTLFEERFWRRAFAGKAPQVLVQPDTPHTYHYIPDVAAGLAALGRADEDVLGRWWVLPCGPPVTTRELVRHIGVAIGRDLDVEVVPGPLRTVLKLFVPIIRELDEMRYQWEQPFVVEDRTFQERFRQPATPLDDAVRETVAWARQAYGRS